MMIGVETTLPLGSVSIKELKDSQCYWWKPVQQETFMDEIVTLEEKRTTMKSSWLLPFHPFLDPQGLLHVGGRINQAELPYSKRHPVILQGNHELDDHFGARSVASCRTHFSSCITFEKLVHLELEEIIRSIRRRCITCRRVAARPSNQEFGQLPAD